MEKFNFDGLLQFIKEQETVAATKYGYNFNLLSEQCGTIVENSHTNILMRILQYKNKYGYVLLEDFISLADFDICIADREVMFRTEYQGEVNSQGRIDGLIWQKDNFAIIVENKINHAGNQKGQIARYVETVVNDGIAEKDRIFVVFLRGMAWRCLIRTARNICRNAASVKVLVTRKCRAPATLLVLIESTSTTGYGMLFSP